MELFEDISDEMRMNALYNAFRNKNLNPEGYNTKMETWINVIDNYCMKYKKISFTQSDLERAFERNNSRPQCLETVLAEMSRQSIIKTRSDFESSLSSWSSWGFNLLVKKPMSWGWSMLSQSIFGPNEATPVQYVNEAAFKEVSSLVLQKLESIINASNNMNTMQEVKMFHNKCLDLCSDFQMFRLILSYLASKDKIVLFNEDGQSYIKLLGVHTTSVDKSKPPVTKVDLGVVKLQNTLEKVQEEIETHESEMEDLRSEASAALKAGKKSKAKALLVKKQRIDKTLQQKLKAAENIEGMLHQLENSVTNQGVMEALKAGVQAHKEAAGGGMTIDKIDQTLEEIEDAFEEQKDIAEAMGRSVTGFNVDVNDADLEEELDLLLELDRLDIKSKTPEDSFDEKVLPEVPQSVIGEIDNPQELTVNSGKTTELTLLQ